MESAKLFSDTPREIVVSKLVQERADEISDLLAVLDNPDLPAGEVSHGPKTFIQRLPRHMRRRAMSHNVKRLPTVHRKFAQKFADQTAYRKKPPSRYHRRRPRNLLQAYIRRQRKHAWLETHIWHAKRFHMVELWGYRLAERSCQRAFRPSYRDAARHCTVQDVSFMCCLELRADFDTLVDGLASMCATDIGPTFRFRPAVNGALEMKVTLYEPGRYPRGCLGPAQFLWKPPEPNSTQRTLWLWLHPAISQDVTNALCTVFALERETENAQNGPESSSLKEWQLNRIQLASSKMSNAENGVVLTSLKDQLGCLSLTGPLSTPILNHVCQTVLADSVEQFLDDWCSLQSTATVLKRQHEFWQSLSSVSPARLPDGTVVSLLVKDPRLAKTAKKQFPQTSMGSGRHVDTASISLESYIWDADIRLQTLETKMPDHQLHSLRAAEQSFKHSLVPVLLITRNLSTNSGLGCGWDLIFPSGWAMPFWIALQYSTARAVGLRDARCLALETGRLTFPHDWHDTEAGRAFCKSETNELQQKWNRRPPNKRIDYWKRYRIKYPFELPWNELMNGADYYVLRDRKILRHLSEVLKGKTSLNAALIEQHENALFPVGLIPEDRGFPKRFGLICLPDQEDFGGKRPHMVLEPLAVKKPKIEISEPKEAKTLSEFVSLDDEECIDLESLFVDKQKLKLEHRKLNKRERRKRRKLPKVAEPPDPDLSANVARSCSRRVIGLVTRGDFSFGRGGGFALGLCRVACVRALCAQSPPSKVLFRNTNSEHYRLCKLTVLL